MKFRFKIQAPLLKEDYCGRKCIYSDFIPTYENPAPTTNVGNLNPGLYAENELVYGLSPPLIEREFDWKAFLLLLIYGFVLPLVLLCQILFQTKLFDGNHAIAETCISLIIFFPNRFFM